MEGSRCGRVPAGGRRADSGAQGGRVAGAMIRWWRPSGVRRVRLPSLSEGGVGGGWSPTTARARAQAQQPSLSGSSQRSFARPLHPPGSTLPQPLPGREGGSCARNGNAGIPGPGIRCNVVLLPGPAMAGMIRLGHPNLGIRVRLTARHYPHRSRPSRASPSGCCTHWSAGPHRPPARCGPIRGRPQTRCPEMRR